MTIAERLDQIQTTPGDRQAVATAVANTLSDGETLQLLGLMLETVPGVVVGPPCDGEAEVLIGRGGHRAIICLGTPDERALIVLRDRDIGLVSDDAALRTLWGPQLVLDSATLLAELQFARDDLDASLYWPAETRIDRLRRRAAESEVPLDVLLAISSRRIEIAGAGQSRGA